MKSLPEPLPSRKKSGQLLRELYQEVVGEPPQAVADKTWVVTDAAKREGDVQRSLCATLAGQWMGRDHRRGIPYAWVVGHLGDGRGRASPRSFLAAIRSAAEDTKTRYPDHENALHYESIKRGVQKASEIRVEELAEDDPWVNSFMKPLRGLTVPCLFEELEKRWRAGMGEAPASLAFDRLPPEHSGAGWHGIRQDLENLKIFLTMKDGRGEHAGPLPGRFRAWPARRGETGDPIGNKGVKAMSLWPVRPSRTRHCPEDLS